jgi:hypothetical protein
MTCRGGRYYYVSQRQGRRVFTTYLGCGDMGAQLVEILKARQRAKEADRQDLREEAEQARQLDAALADIYLAAEQAASAALLGAGFHRHHRSWRRKRCPHEV